MEGLFLGQKYTTAFSKLKFTKFSKVVRGNTWMEHVADYTHPEENPQLELNPVGTFTNIQVNENLSFYKMRMT